MTPPVDMGDSSYYALTADAKQLAAVVISGTPYNTVQYNTMPRVVAFVGTPDFKTFWHPEYLIHTKSQYVFELVCVRRKM